MKPTKFYNLLVNCKSMKPFYAYETHETHLYTINWDSSVSPREKGLTSFFLPLSPVRDETMKPYETLYRDSWIHVFSVIESFTTLYAFKHTFVV